MQVERRGNQFTMPRRRRFKPRRDCVAILGKLSSLYFLSFSSYCVYIPSNLHRDTGSCGHGFLWVLVGSGEFWWVFVGVIIYRPLDIMWLKSFLLTLCLLYVAPITAILLWIL